MKYDVVINVSGTITIDANNKTEAIEKVKEKGLWYYAENLDNVELLGIPDAVSH